MSRHPSLKRLLVTGGCGFIGSNFVRYCREQFPQLRIVNLDALTYAGNLGNLTGIQNDHRYRFVKGDICDGKLLSALFDEEQIDTVVHFAAESHVDRSILSPDAFIITNIVGTFRLLEAARQAWLSGRAGIASEECRFIHVSTDEVYGSLGDTGYFTETTCYDPRSPYSASKASSDHMVRSYFHTYGFPAIVTNCSNNYGPYQLPEKLIPLMIHNALNGRELPVYGDGKNVRDWIFVADHCRALGCVLQSGRPGETYTIGGNSERTNIDVVNTICDAIDEIAGPLANGLARRSLIRFVKDRPGHDRRYAIDASKINRELGWAPTVDFNDGLRKTIHWNMDNDEWVAAVVSGEYKKYYESQYGVRQENACIR